MTASLLTLEERAQIDARAIAAMSGNHEANGECDDLEREDKWERRYSEPVLHHAAYYGLAGKIIKAIEPETEAHPAGMLMELLAAFGNAVHRGPYVAVGPVWQRANLFVVKAGATSIGRKGQGWAEVKRIMNAADPLWVDACITSGLSSGEGLIKSLSDEKDPDGNLVVIEKRAMIVEAEFARLLRVGAREKNILFDVLRDAWDGEALRVKTRANPLQAIGAHVSNVGHCTVEELTSVLDDILVANGVANRYLFSWVNRTKKLPFGGKLSAQTIETLAKELRDAIQVARETRCVSWGAEAARAWEKLYNTAFEMGSGGLAGALIARGQPYTLRLALNYALLDCAKEISLAHLRAGYAVWRYSEDSTRYIFGNRLGDPSEQHLLDAARDVHPDGLNGVAQDKATNGRGTARARKALVDRGLLREEKIASDGGRPSTVIFAVTFAELADKAEKGNPLNDPDIFPTLTEKLYPSYSVEDDREVIS
jgi:Protein of unknown function (DUF3987)